MADVLDFLILQQKQNIPSLHVHTLSINIKIYLFFLIFFTNTEVMDLLKESVPDLEKIITEIGELAESGGKYQEAPHVIEVTLPMLCSYLPYWLAQGTIMADG